MRKKFFTRVVKHWKKLPRKVPIPGKIRSQVEWGAEQYDLG